MTTHDRIRKLYKSDVLNSDDTIPILIELLERIETLETIQNNQNLEKRVEELESLEYNRND